MEEDKKVKLHGMWASTYSKRVELALKIKGIPYDYVEEDLSNKSQSLLLYNPVYKKVPVLVCNGRPISESLVILEYIDENWTEAPRLLPDDPYERAKVRFWANFLHQQLFQSIGSIVALDGEEQERAVKEAIENLRIAEEGLQRDFFSGGNHSFKGRELGFLDIILSAVLSPYKAMEEATGAKILDPDRNPLIVSWVTALNDLPVLKESLPPHDKLVAFLQFIRGKHLQSSTI